MYGSSYGKHFETPGYDQYSAYKEEIPYLMNRAAVLPSKIKLLKKLRTMDLSDVKKSDMPAGSEDVLKGTLSSHVHRDFLEKALKSIEAYSIDVCHI